MYEFKSSQSGVAMMSLILNIYHLFEVRRFKGFSSIHLESGSVSLQTVPWPLCTAAPIRAADFSPQRWHCAWAMASYATDIDGSLNLWTWFLNLEFFLRKSNVLYRFYTHFYSLSKVSKVSFHNPSWVAQNLSITSASESVSLPPTHTHSHPINFFNL